MIKLDFDTIKKLTFGAEYVAKSDGKIVFSRFTQEERSVLDYGRDNSFATAGVRIEFETDSSVLEICAETKQANEHGRNFYSFDICCNNELIGQLKNFNDDLIYPYKEYPLGEIEKTFTLPWGFKRLSIYFPWSVQGKIKAISLDNGALIRPVNKKRNLLMYGDSITQGYDAKHPMCSYASKLTDIIYANGINKGIGGSCFMPNLARNKSMFNPDFITVAYGTNSWNGSSKEDFKKRCSEFFQNIEIIYPDTPVFAISPIWRADCTEKRKFGDFFQVSEIIKEIVLKYKNIIFINGVDFIPKNKEYFRDSYLHPNDDGFAYYTKALIKEIKKYACTLG